MTLGMKDEIGEEMKRKYPQKFAAEAEIFSRIHRGARIFIHSACAEPQYLVRALIKFVESNPKAFFDTSACRSSWSLTIRRRWSF